MCNFEETLKAESRREGQDQAFPITLAINAFRGFLNEFHKKKENHDLPDVPKVKKEKKKKDKDKDHGFVSAMRRRDGAAARRRGGAAARRRGGAAARRRGGAAARRCNSGGREAPTNGFFLRYVFLIPWYMTY